MKNCSDRTKIDNQLVLEIESKLIKFGVPTDKAFAAYDAIRFQCEARAVLLNRVQDREMPAEIEFYGAFLSAKAKEVGVEYFPCQPVL